MPQPLSKHPLVHSRSLESTKAMYASASTPVEVDSPARGFEMAINRVAFGGLSLMSLSTRMAVRARTPARDASGYSVMIPLVGGSRVVADGVRFETRPRVTGGVNGPGDAVDVSLPDDHTGLEIVVPRRLVEDTFAALVGVERRPVRFAAQLDLRAPTGASLLRLLSLLVAEIDAGTMTTMPLVADRLAEGLVMTLLHHSHDQRALLDRRAAATTPAAVGRAEEYMREHLTEPLTLAELAAIAGVSVRTLQAGFRVHRGASPMGLLRTLRLEHARRLLETRHELTVTEVAFASGFEHLGRFSARYRRRYGETPTQTRRSYG